MKKLLQKYIGIGPDSDLAFELFLISFMLLALAQVSFIVIYEVNRYFGG